MSKTLADLTTEEIAGILNTAMDDGEWHTPSAYDISIKEQTIWAVYGWFNCSKHNTYHDQERWFNINNNNVQIWIKEYVKGRADKSLYKPIHNFKMLGELIESLRTPEPKTPEGDKSGWHIFIKKHTSEHFENAAPVEIGSTLRPTREEDKYQLHEPDGTPVVAFFYAPFLNKGYTQPFKAEGDKVEGKLNFGNSETLQTCPACGHALPLEYFDEENNPNCYMCGASGEEKRFSSEWDKVAEAARKFAETKMTEGHGLSWDRFDHIAIGSFYSFYLEYIKNNFFNGRVGDNRQGIPLGTVDTSGIEDHEEKSQDELWREIISHIIHRYTPTEELKKEFIIQKRSP